jgi:uncharacterized protein DUF4339
MANEWYVKTKGEEIGPLSDDALRKMVAKRQLTPDDLVRKWQFGTWQPAAKVRGLFERMAAPNTLPAEGQSTHSLPSFAPDPNIILEEISLDDVTPPKHAKSPKPFVPSSARLIPCPDCGKHISKNATSCPNCGRPNTVRSNTISKNDTPKTTKSKPPLVRWPLVAVLGGFFAITALIAGINESSQSGSRGSASTVSGSSLRKDTAAAINGEVYSRLTELAVAGDNSGIATLIAAGLTVTLPEGTRVRVIDLGFLTTEIKVESGTYAGRYFIVATENINR